MILIKDNLLLYCHLLLFYYFIVHEHQKRLNNCLPSTKWTLDIDTRCQVCRNGYYLHICVLFFLARTGRSIIFSHAGADCKVSNTQSFEGGTFEGQLVFDGQLKLFESCLLFLIKKRWTTSSKPW